jgi:hypothetical protein
MSLDLFGVVRLQKKQEKHPEILFHFVVFNIATAAPLGGL